MIQLNRQNSIDVSAGILESLRVVQDKPGQDGPYEAVILRGRVTAGGAFTAVIPFVNAMFRNATIKEIAAMGAATLALTACWDADLEEPLVVAAAMGGSPNLLRLGATTGINSEPFSSTQDASSACPVRINITGATGSGRFVLKIVFRRA